MRKERNARFVRRIKKCEKRRVSKNVQEGQICAEGEENGRCPEVEDCAAGTRDRKGSLERTPEFVYARGGDARRRWRRTRKVRKTR